MRMNDFVWVIGGGLLQVPIIQEFKKRGYDVLVSDRDIKCAGGQFADSVIQLDTYDLDAHGMYAQMLEQAPVAVVADAIDVGPTVSMLAEIYGLPACSYQAADKARNKALMRLALDLPHPIYTIVLPDDEVNDVLHFWYTHCAMHDLVAFPCIVKPVDNSASRGVTKCHNAAELAEAITYARMYNKYATSVLIEECLSGRERATDWFVQDRQVYYVNGAERFFEGVLETGHINPAPLPNREMQQLANLAAQRLGVRTGPFKLDFMYDDRYGWCILECATRWSGGFDHTHTQVYATGRNLVELLADYALTGRFDVTRLDYEWHKYAMAYAPVLPEGKKLRPEHIERIKELPGVQEVIVRQYGISKPWYSCADRQVFIITVGTKLGVQEQAIAAGNVLKEVMNV